MQFESFAEFIAMGKHGFYVWLAYGATLSVIMGYLAHLRMSRRKIIQQLRWQQDDGGQSADVQAHTSPEERLTKDETVE